MTEADGRSEAVRAIEAVRATLRSGRRAPVAPELAAVHGLEALLDELVEMYRYALAMSNGDLDQPLTARGSFAGALKAISASLHHVTWQAQRVSEGDLSQRVDFMGDFSAAFNAMVGRIDELATRDALTGASNRRSFDEVARKALAGATRYGHALSFFILDIDHFKRVNDTFGHEAGDQVLVAIAGLVRDGIRATDHLARWGGEEFVVLTPQVDVRGAADLAERLRRSIGEHDIGARRPGHRQFWRRPVAASRDPRFPVRTRGPGALQGQGERSRPDRGRRLTRRGSRPSAWPGRATPSAQLPRAHADESGVARSFRQSLVRVALTLAAGAAVLLVPAPAALAAAAGAGQSYGAGVPIPFSIFPSDNAWNTPVDALPVDADSADYIAHMAPDTGLHPDFGTVWEGAAIGIPYVVVPGDQKKVQVHFVEYGDESDPGPYPIPPNAPVEGAGGPYADGDRHVLVLDADNQVLYELYDAVKQPDGSWNAGSGAVWDLKTNAQRPDGWTSADAAGLPMLPGLARYDEIVTEGVLDHALRFTVSETQAAYISPATHYASRLDRSGPAAHGAARAAQGRLRHQRLLARRPGHPQGAQEVRHDRGRQRRRLVRRRRAGPALERRRHCTRSTRC